MIVGNTIPGGSTLGVSVDFETTVSVCVAPDSDPM